MSIRPFFLLLLLPCLVGCTHQHMVAPTEDRSFASINERAATKHATVILADVSEHTARALQMTADSTSWLLPESEIVRSVATEEVARVVFLNRDKGALEGVGLGFLVGGIVGAIIGLADGDDDPDGWFALTAEEKAGYAGLTLGLVGGAVGLPVGAVIGSRDVYMLETTAGAEPAEE